MWKRFKHSLKGIYIVYCRELKLIISDMGLLLFLCFLPVVYPLVYSLIYNPELVKDVPMVVVDNDRTPLSRELARKIDACDQAWVRGYASDLNEARRAMAGRDCYAILEIPEGFERSVGNNATAQAVMYCDMGLLLRYRGFVVAATNVMMDMGAEILTQKIDDTVPLVGTVADGDLLPIANINMGNIQGGFDTFIMPGIVVLILQQCIILVIGMAGGAKRERRTLVRYDADNYEPSIFGTMCAQMLAYITILILPAVFMIHYVPLIFSFPIAGNMFEEMAFLLPLVIACFGLGFAFQGLVTERESVFVCWVITSVVFLFLSGMIWPRYDMAPVWKALSDICPSTWGVEGFIKMSSNGSSLAQVSHEYLMLWILAAAWWAAGWVVQLTAVRPAMLRQQARNIIIFNRLMRSGYFGGKKIQNDRTDNRQ